MVISFVTALTLMLAFIFGSPNVKRYKRDGLSFEESRFYCLHCTYCYISAKLHPPGSRAALPLPRPLRTHRASFPAVRSSLSNARLSGRGAATYDCCCACTFFFANDARGGFHR